MFWGSYVGFGALEGEGGSLYGLVLTLLVFCLKNSGIIQGWLGLLTLDQSFCC